MILFAMLTLLPLFAEPRCVDAMSPSSSSCYPFFVLSYLRMISCSSLDRKCMTPALLSDFRNGVSVGIFTHETQQKPLWSPLKPGPFAAF